MHDRLPSLEVGNDLSLQGPSDEVVTAQSSRGVDEGMSNYRLRKGPLPPAICLHQHTNIFANL